MKRGMLLFVSAVAVSLGFAAGDVPAQTAIDTKTAEQQKLIDKAVASKGLTKEEGKVVHDNLTRIKERGKGSAGKKMEPLEEGNVENMLERNARMITDKKNHPVRPFNHPEVTHRFENQQKRIDDGIKSGVLTKQEATQLQDNLSKAKADYEAMKKDGTFTQAEEDKIHALLDKDSRIIRNKKRN